MPIETLVIPIVTREYHTPSDKDVAYAQDLIRDFYERIDREDGEFIAEHHVLVALRESIGVHLSMATGQMSVLVARFPKKDPVPDLDRKI